MKQKKILFCIIILSMPVFYGCVNTISLTEDERNLISRYAAGKILNHSEKYDGRLAPASTENVSSAQPESTVGSADPVPTVEPELTPESGKPTESGQPMKSDTSDYMEVELDGIYKIQGLTFSYSTYEFHKKYLNEMIANEGEILLVLKFHVKNMTKDTIPINLIKRDKINYLLEIENEAYVPEISFAEYGGLNFLKTKIRGGKQKEAVLIYFLPRKAQKAGTITLRVQEGKEEAIVKLK